VPARAEVRGPGRLSPTWAVQKLGLFLIDKRAST
jgi:hypothetical protein